MAVAYAGSSSTSSTCCRSRRSTAGRITRGALAAHLVRRRSLLGALFLWQPNPMLLLIALLAAPQLVKAWKYDPKAAGERELLRDHVAPPRSRSSPIYFGLAPTSRSWPIRTHALI
jgi:hypothetical protein